jgi:hypothetical protein
MINEEHRHMLDEQNGDLLCACRACAVLFQREAAGRGHYRVIPDRRVQLTPFPTKDLGVPVGLAFFVKQQDGAVVAHYPSPMGVTKWEVDTEVWQSLCLRFPDLRDLATAVEAVLVNTARGACEHWVVPVDDCYRLVAVIRREWRGLSGGSEVWPAIERFFTDLRVSGRSTQYSMTN